MPGRILLNDTQMNCVIVYLKELSWGIPTRIVLGVIWKNCVKL